MTQMPRTFWMVYGLHQGAPTVRHESLDSALTEAKRLARTHPEIGFFVLEATHHVLKRDVDITLIDRDFAEIPMVPRHPVAPDNEIPF